MRMIKLLLLWVVLLAASASSAAAQDWDDRGYFHVSFGGQSQEQTFTDSATFTIYNDRGASAAGHSFGGGTLIDVAAGARVWRSFGVGLAYSNNSNESDGIVTARVPHPVIVGQPREATYTASDLEHSESVVHLQFLWMLPFRQRMQLAFMAGPSFFSVTQDIATPVQGPANIIDNPPFTSVTITNIGVTEQKDSPVGFNIGVDGSYLFTPMIGVGAFVRYSGAALDFPTPGGVTRDGDPDAGGVQAAIGLRLRF